jgi:hypothetical protein
MSKLGAVVFATSLAFAGAANATTVVDYENGTVGQTEGEWTLVDDGAGGIAASTTAKYSGHGYILVFFRGIRSDMPFSPLFGAVLDHDFSDKFTDEAETHDLIFPSGGYIKTSDGNLIFAPGERMRFFAGDLLQVFADEVWIDNVEFVRTNVSSLVPEPATWAMMIAGFGLAGVGLRRSRAQRQAPLRLQQAS